MSPSNLSTCLKLLAVTLIASLASACSNYHYKDYQGDWAPERMVPYDLTHGEVDAPVVYFATTRYRALGVKYHRLLLATDVDGQRLEGAGRRSLLDISGKQALQLMPGTHSLTWCWVSMNALGTGGAICDIKAKDVEFEEGQRYVVDFVTREDIAGPHGRQYSTLNVTSEIRNLDTHEVIYPRKEDVVLTRP